MDDTVSGRTRDGVVRDVGGSGGTGRALRIAVVGVSTGHTCGVHDHAALLAQALEREGVSCRLHWLWRSQTSLRAGRAEVRAWARELKAALDRDPPDAILLHYSVFSYSYRGAPLFVAAVLSAVRRARTPLLVVLHEFAYPWALRGWRGKLLAAMQRAMLVDVVRTCTALVLTTDTGADWVASRWWLARRRARVVPVFSNLPPSTAVPAHDRTRPILGLFGYASEGVAPALTLDALRLLQARGVEVELALLGAPGQASLSGEAWLAAARARRVANTLSFSGVLPAQELSDALASCDVLLFAEAIGPTSRKTTLAAALASGRPVIAIDGPRRWPELARSDAVRLVAPTPRGLTDGLEGLLGAERSSTELGERGRRFYEERMSVSRGGESIASLLGELVGARANAG